MHNLTLILTFPKLAVPIIFLCLITLTACNQWDWDLEQENFPEVVTIPEVTLGDTPTEIRVSAGIAGLLAGASVDAHGHLWSTGMTQPTLNDEVDRSRFNRLGNGTFSSTISRLTPGQPIYFRAYAIFEEEVFYGAVQSYTPEELNFQIVTDTVVQITTPDAPLSAVSFQSVIVNLPLGVTVKNLGLCWATDPDPTVADNLTLDGLDILNVSSTLSYQSKLNNLAVGRYYARSYAIIGERVYYGNTLCFNWGDFWNKLRNFPARDRPNVFSFAINGRAYVGGGGRRAEIATFNFDTFFNDHWSFDPVANRWSPLAEVPGELAPYDLKSFIVNDRVFLGFGDGSLYNFSPDVFYNDLWEYLPETDQWIEKDSFPPGPRGELTAFAVNGLIYAGMGRDEDRDNSILFQDFWQYDPTSEQWTRKKDFPGGPRKGGESFTIGEKGYLLDGSAFWEYLPLSDEWQPKAYPTELTSYPNYLFTLRDRAYFQTGNGLWEYNPAEEQWTPRSTFLSNPPSVHFAIDQVGYIGLDIWAYYPLSECE